MGDFSTLSVAAAMRLPSDSENLAFAMIAGRRAGRDRRAGRADRARSIFVDENFQIGIGRIGQRPIGHAGFKSRRPALAGLESMRRVERAGNLDAPLNEMRRVEIRQLAYAKRGDVG